MALVPLINWLSLHLFGATPPYWVSWTLSEVILMLVVCVGLMLGVASTLLIQSQMPQREVSAKSDGKDNRLPGFGAGEQPTREVPAEQPVHRAQPVPRLIVQQSVSSATVDSSALGGGGSESVIRALIVALLRSTAPLSASLLSP